MSLDIRATAYIQAQSYSKEILFMLDSGRVDCFVVRSTDQPSYTVIGSERGLGIIASITAIDSTFLSTAAMQCRAGRTLQVLKAHS